MAKVTTKSKTEEKFLTAKDLATMAGVEPRELRRCLRTHFANRLATTKGANGMKTYQIKANDPIVKEVLAKLKGNGDKGKVAAKAEVKTAKVEAPKLTKKQKAEAKKQTKVNAKQQAALAKVPDKDKEPIMPSDRVTEADSPTESQDDKGEGEEPSPESQFAYKGYRFTLHSDFTVTVINPDNSISQHNCLANALHQRGFSFKQLVKEGAVPEEVINGK